MNDIFKIFFHPREVAEIRGIDIKGTGPWKGWAKGTVSGYFNDAIRRFWPGRTTAYSQIRRTQHRMPTSAAYDGCRLILIRNCRQGSVVVSTPFLLPVENPTLVDVMKVVCLMARRVKAICDDLNINVDIQS